MGLFHSCCTRVQFHLCELRSGESFVVSISTWNLKSIDSMNSNPLQWFQLKLNLYVSYKFNVTTSVTSATEYTWNLPVALRKWNVSIRKTNRGMVKIEPIQRNEDIRRQEMLIIQFLLIFACLMSFDVILIKNQANWFICQTKIVWFQRIRNNLLWW